MVDTFNDREVEMLTYLRNTVVDPSGRGTATTETFAAAGTQTTFTLTNTLVKSISSVLVNGVAKYIGYDYSVSYGEGAGVTTITLRVAPGDGISVVIAYRYGTAMIYYGFQRLDSELPRIAIIPENYTPRMMSIGEQSDGTGKWIYYDCTYTAEIRSRFAKQLKSLSLEFANAINLFRQSTPQPHRMVIVSVNNIKPEDFDNDLRLYRSQVNFTITYMFKFKD